MPRDITSNVEKYILLPPHGLRTPRTAEAEPTRELFRSMSVHPPVLQSPPENLSYRVLDSIDVTGAKLVEMTPEMADAIRAEKPSVRIIPLVYYGPTILRSASFRPIRELFNKMMGTQSVVSVKVRGGRALANAKIRLITSRSLNERGTSRKGERGL